EPANGRVIGRRLRQRVAEKGPYLDRVGAARGDRTFARKAFEKADHQHPEEDFRIHAGAAIAGVVVERSARLPEVIAEADLLQVMMQATVERMGAGSGQFVRGNPQRTLLRTGLGTVHRAARRGKGDNRKFTQYRPASAGKSTAS